MSHVKFLETRNYRPSPSGLTIKYQRGQIYPFQPHMRQYLDIGHAELVEVDGTPPPAVVMPPSAMGRKKAAAEAQSTERSIPMRDPGPPLRDPVKNGGFSEA